MLNFLLERFQEHSEKTAIIYKEKEYTYGWLLNEYKRWKIFLNENQVEPNAVVVLKADFTSHSIGLLLALIENINIFVPLSPVVKNQDELIEIAEAEYCITLTEKVKIEKTDVKADHEILLKLKKNNHQGLILFSSGTTGEPKAVVHDISLLLQKFRKPGKTYKTITFLLFDHIGGFNTLFHILSSSGTAVALENRMPDEVCRLIEKYQVELLPTSPTFINMILFSRAYERFDISCLKLVTYGTESMPEITLQRFHELFPNIRLKQTYGLSEIGIMPSNSESSDSLWLKVGGENFKTKVLDNKLWVKAETSMLGYLNAPLPFTEEGWLNTGDQIDVKGNFIKFLGRESEIINVGGQKVYPTEVESVLLEIEDVEDTVVYGESHPLMGNVVVADIRVNSMDNRKELISKIQKYCRNKLETFKIPLKINIVDNILTSNRFKRKR
ncbi:Long-chain fatty acid--CoA ligase [Candidatus Magnetomoraceae bacterium gMMP-15]